jgi:hypothetical protein
MEYVTNEILCMKSVEDPIPPHAVAIILILMLLRCENRQQALRAATIGELHEASKRIRKHEDGMVYREMKIHAEMKRSKEHGLSRQLFDTTCWPLICQYMKFIRPRFVQAFR